MEFLRCLEKQTLRKKKQKTGIGNMWVKILPSKLHERSFCESCGRRYIAWKPPADRYLLRRRWAVIMQKVLGFPENLTLPKKMLLDTQE